MAQSLTAHPLAKLFPDLPDPEFAALVEDIRENGVKIPILVYRGQILDGRQRYRAQKEFVDTEASYNAALRVRGELLCMCYLLRSRMSALSDARHAGNTLSNRCKSNRKSFPHKNWKCSSGRFAT